MANDPSGLAGSAFEADASVLKFQWEWIEVGAWAFRKRPLIQ